MKNRFAFPTPVLLLLALLLVVTGRSAAQESGEAPLTENMRRLLADQQPAEDLEPMGATPCVGGMAGSYPCDNVDLLAFIPLASFSALDGNDSWGWTDPLDGKEYALMGLDNGTAFVDISNPTAPVYLGKLPTHTGSSTWRDIKVYNNYAFVVSDNNGAHGMQVFDLTELRNVPNPPVTFSETEHYNGFGSAHNLVINENSGYAYAVGTSTCSGGLHMVNIQDPENPTNAGCFSQDGYTHDAQCVNYIGPDPDHQGKEICFNSNTDTLTIADVTNKGTPVQLSRTGYTGSAYTHQGWLTEDHVYFLLDDELDETSFGHSTRTRVFDVSNLDMPVLVGFYDATTGAIDHNQYVKGNDVFQANYRAGMRVLDIRDVANANLCEVGYFDIYPANDSPSFNGAWNVYPYYDSGLVIVSGIEQGLFILQPTVTASALEAALLDSTAAGKPGETVLHTLVLSNTGTADDSYDLVISGETWNTTLVTGSPVAVPAGSTAMIEVEVEVPAGATINDADSFTLTAASTNSSCLSVAAQGATEVTGQAAISTSGDAAGQGMEGEVVIYDVTVTNDGDVADTYSVAVSGNSWDTQLSTSSVGPLAPGEQATIQVMVTVGAEMSDEATITFTSTFDPAVSASLTLETTRSDMEPMMEMYLPLMLNEP